MNTTLDATMRMIREVGQAATIKQSRSFTDFLSDRIVQAATGDNLLSVMERLTSLVQASVGEISPSVMAGFISACSAPDANAVLTFIRQHPNVVTMLTKLNESEYSDAIRSVVVPESGAHTGVALPAGEFQISLKLTCISPLSHGSDTKAGNATIFRRMQVISTDGNVLSLPYYSGNAIRGQMRDLLADDFLRAIGLSPRRDNPPIALWFFHSLYAGGALEENSAAEKALKKALGINGSIRAEGIREFRAMLPNLSLLGCAVGNRILAGRVKFSDFRPGCTQWGNGTLDVSTLYEWLYLTRREDHEAHEKNSSMIATTECLRSGTTLYGGIDLDMHATPVERSALGHGLRLLSDLGYIGADGRRGLGRVNIEIGNAPDPAEYQDYLRDNRQSICDYLTRLGVLRCTQSS